MSPMLSHEALPALSLVLVWSALIYPIFSSFPKQSLDPIIGQIYGSIICMRDNEVQIRGYASLQ